jgi:hypothetical protein
MLVGLVALDIWVYVIYLVMKGGMWWAQMIGIR